MLSKEVAQNKIKWKNNDWKFKVVGNQNVLIALNGMIIPNGLQVPRGRFWELAS